MREEYTSAKKLHRENARLRQRVVSLEKKLKHLRRLQITHAQQSQDLDLIIALNNAINRGDSLNKILNLIARRTERIFSSQGAVIYLLSEDGKFLILQQNVGLMKRIRTLSTKTRIKIPKTITIDLSRSRIYKRVLKHGRPQLINDAQQIKRLISEFIVDKSLNKYLTKIFAAIGIKSVINIPLISRGRRLGLIDIANDKPFTRADVKRFKAFAEQTALILNRLRYKEKLRESEDKYRRLVENSLNGVVMIQEEKLIFVNRACCRISGYTSDELVGESITKVIAPEDQKIMLERSKKRLRGEKVPNYYTFKGVRKDGQIRYVELSTGPAFRYKGKPTSLVVIRDVTERREMEQSLIRSEERFRKFMESATEGLVLFDARLNLINANDFILDLFGVRREDFLGVNLVDISFRSWESGRVQKYMDVVETGKPLTVDDVIVQSPFGDKHLTIKAFKVGDGLGMIVRDVTDLTHAEQALKESEQRYRAIVEEQTDLICRFTPDLILTYVNEAYCNYFDRTKEELVGMNFIDLILEKDRAFVEKKIRALNRDNPVGILEERVITPEGKIKWQQWINRALFDDDGEIFEYQSVGRDITGLKEHK